MFLRISILISILAAACPIWGQAPQKMVREKDFPLWHGIRQDKVSDDGNWLSYTKQYENKIDTLFVRSIKPRRTFTMPGGTQGRFGNGFFSCLLPDSTLSILDLTSHRKVMLQRCSSYDTALDGGRITALQQQNKKRQDLLIMDRKANVLDSFINVTSSKKNSPQTQLAFVQKTLSGYSLVLYDIAARRSRILFHTYELIHTLAFAEDSKQIAFLSENTSKACSAHLINLSSGSGKSFKTGISDSVRIVKDLGLRISRDGAKVFLGTLAGMAKLPAESSNVEIWNTGDRVIYPLRTGPYSIESPVLSVWIPAEETLFRLAEAEEHAYLSGGENFVMVQKQVFDGQEGKRYGLADLYVLSLKTRKKVLAVKAAQLEKGFVRLSPSADKLVYYKNDAWHCYDMNEDKNIHITQAVGGSWDNKQEVGIETEVYADPIWTEDGKSILLHDKNDVWLFAADGTAPKRLTNGKERDIIFRIDSYSLKKEPGRQLYAASVSLEAAVPLTARGSSNENGFFLLEKNRMPSPLFYGDFAADQLRRSKNGRYFSRVQSFAMPPSLRWTDGPGKELHNAVQSNPQHFSYSWGGAKLMAYRSPDGRYHKAALLYPAGYDPVKKYPMIVYIYQSMSNLMHEYMIPSVYNEEGFNPVNYTLDGYLVLLPDIGYTYGKTGIAAAQCIEAAVENIKKTGIADSARIGIIGHSFGGYEVNFLMTRTDVFAAAVTGSGVSDVTGFYFSSEKYYKGSHSWRFESQQWRMGASFYDAKESYYENSPLFHAEKITTPLLIWSGMEDTIIPPYNSTALYYALRSLQKPALMLLYKEEDHLLENIENQKDLSAKVKHWFDHYLKDALSEDWILEKL